MSNSQRLINLWNKEKKPFWLDHKPADNRVIGAAFRRGEFQANYKKGFEVLLFSFRDNNHDWCNIIPSLPWFCKSDTVEKLIKGAYNRNNDKKFTKENSIEMKTLEPIQDNRGEDVDWDKLRAEL